MDGAPWPEDYAIVPPPYDLEYLWDIFWDLRDSCSGNGFGPTRIPHTEFVAWQQVMRIQLTPLECSILKALDAEYMRISAQSKTSTADKDKRGR